jgi:hypothetical protein
MAVHYTIEFIGGLTLLGAVSQDFLNLAISRAVNAPDIMQVEYDASSYNVQQLIIGRPVIVTRVDTEAGISPSVEFAGLIRRIVRRVSNTTTFQVTAVGMMALLGDRIVAWKSGIINRSVWRNAPAEQVLRNLFSFNIGVNATTANGRLLAGDLTGMTNSATGNTGNLISIGLAQQNLLSAMQKVADVGGGDFSLSYTPYPSTWVFNWHLGQLGTDRTATVLLSVPLGTISELIVDDNRINDFTISVVGGTGEGAARLFAVRPATLPTLADGREKFVDARNEKKGTIGRLRQVGQIAINRQRRKRTTYTVSLLQNAALRYGRDYFLGDLVTILDVPSGNFGRVDGGVPITQKISEVGLEFQSDGRETVDVTLSNP